MAAPQQTKEQQQDGLLAGQARLCLGATSEFAVDPLERVRRPQRLPLRFRKAQKGEEIVARFLEALDHRRTPQSPLLRETGPRLIDERAGLGVRVGQRVTFRPGASERDPRADDVVVID